jgi:hypothetical protein
MRESKTENLKVRVEREMHDRLVEQAALRRRPVSNLLRLIVSDWLAEHADDRAAA